MQTPSDPPMADVLHLRLKTLDERVFDVEATSSMSVADFRAKVALATAVPAPRQRLIYRGKLLKDGVALAVYDLQDGHTVHLVAKPPTRVATTAVNSSTTQTSSATNQEDDEDRETRRPDQEAAGPAWNLASLRSALRRTATATTQPLPMLREILEEMNESPQEAVDAMGLSSFNRNSTVHSTRASAVDLEPITQGILTVRTVLSTAVVEQPAELATELSMEEAEQENTTAVQRGPRQFFVGQWLDVKDTVNQWLESTVMDIADGKVLVHYHGWPSRWDEWIDFNSERIAAFRTRTLHTQNTLRMSPVPTTRVPSAPRVGGNDVRRIVVDVRNLMREMMPHIDRLAELCEDDLSREEEHNQQPIHESLRGLFEDLADETTEEEETRESEVSEVAHLVAPLFDRFGRLLMDSVGYFDPLLRPELRGEAQRQQERRSAAMRHGQGNSAQRQSSEVATSMEAQDNSLSIRDLIATSPTQSESNQPRRSIDVHIHAIVAPASLSSLASLTRGMATDAASTQRRQIPSTPPRFDDTRDLDEDGDHSRVPLLGSYRRRSDTHEFNQRRTEARDLDALLTNDFFRPSFDHDDDSDDESSSSFTHSDARQGGRSAYRPPSPSTQITSPRTPPSDDNSQYTSGSIGVIPEVAEAEERLRARESAARDDENTRDSSASSASSSGFPTFLEVMRRTLSGVRNLVNNEPINSPVEELSRPETSEPMELAPGFPLPSSSSPASSSSSTRDHWSRAISSRSRSSSGSSIEEDLDLDEVD